jgi:molybdopterin-synthase adenylyltransferase
MHDDSMERYARHLILPEFLHGGQDRLRGSSVLVIGAGGLGSPAALYLAAAGVGTIGLCDFDAVEVSNLQRQVLHATSDIGRPKVESAREHLAALNPSVDFVLHPHRADASNLREMVRGYDFVLDCADGFPIKFLINDACVLENKPFCHAGVLRWEGQLLTCLPWRSASYRCVFSEPPPPEAVPSCSQAGVFGPLVGVLGTLQASEAIKYLIGVGQEVDNVGAARRVCGREIHSADPGELLENRLWVIDLLHLRTRIVKVARRPDWPAGTPHPTITSLVEAPSGAVCPRP